MKMALDNLAFMQDAVRRAGHGEVSEIVHRATILREGWEMDNHGWVVRMNDGSFKGFTTSHGSLCPWPPELITEKINETAQSLQSLKKALDLLKP
jgi:hypothetical protein